MKNKLLAPQDIMLAVESLKEKAYHDICQYLDELPSNLQDKRLLIHVIEAVTAQLIIDTAPNKTLAVDNFMENVKAHIDFLLNENRGAAH